MMRKPVMYEARPLTRWAMWSFFVFAACLAACGSVASGDDENSEAEDGDQVHSCTVSTACPTGQFCSARGLCIDACTSNADCSDSVCDTGSGRCKECLEDATCQARLGDAAYCDTLYSTCRLGCNNCQENESCVNERCVAATSVDGDDESEADADSQEGVTCPDPPAGYACSANCAECASSSESRQCSADGKGYVRHFCTTSEFCNVATGLCEAVVCTPNTRRCSTDSASVEVCNAIGSAWDKTVCVSPQRCVDNACQDRVCSMGDDHPLLFDFNTRSAIATPDRTCTVAINRGAAVFDSDINERGTVTFAPSGDTKPFMTLPASAIAFTQNFSLAVRLKTTGSSGVQTLLSKGYPAGSRKADAQSFALTLEDNHPVFYVNTSGALRTLRGTCSLTTGYWHWVVATFDGTTLTLRADGEDCVTPASIGSAQAIYVNSEPVMIGAARSNSGSLINLFSGSLATLFIAPFALSSNEAAYFTQTGTLCSSQNAVSDSTCDALCAYSHVTVNAGRDWVTSQDTFTLGEAFVLDPGGCAYTSTPVETTACLDAAGEETSDVCASCPLPDGPRYALLAALGKQTSLAPLRSRKVEVMPYADVIQFLYNDDTRRDDSGGFDVLIERGYCRAGLLDLDRQPVTGLDRGCQQGMVPLPDHSACIDRYEASCAASTATANVCSGEVAALSVPGKQPWVSLAASTARQACERAAKRLCSPTEWQASCQGVALSRYPYGDTFATAACNDSTHAVGAPFSLLLPTGYMPACSSDRGALDLTGNAAEFVYDGFNYDARAPREDGTTCLTTGRASIADTETGFRCCKTPE